MPELKEHVITATNTLPESEVVPHVAAVRGGRSFVSSHLLLFVNSKMGGKMFNGQQLDFCETRE